MSDRPTEERNTRAWRRVLNQYHSDSLPGVACASNLAKALAEAIVEVDRLSGESAGELAAELLADDVLLQKAIALYCAENSARGAWVEQSRRVRLHYVRKAQSPETKPAPAEPGEIPTAQEFADWNNLAVTSEWRRGWEACRMHANTMARSAPEPSESGANAKSRRETVEHCDKAGDFVTDVDGYVYFWPCRHGRGHMASHHLRWIADELDRRNGPWDAEIAAYFDKQPSTKKVLCIACHGEHDVTECPSLNGAGKP